MAGDAIGGAAAVYAPTGTMEMVGTWAITDNKVNGVSFDQSVDRADFKRSGAVIGRRWYNVQHKCRITFTPTGTTRALALAKIRTIGPGVVVTLAQSLGGTTDASGPFDGAWTFDGEMTVNVSDDGSAPVTISLNLVRVAPEGSMTPAAWGAPI